MLAPRYARQTADLEGLAIVNKPIALDRSVPFVALLKAVDCVLCSGGTMLREAAYLGISADGIFASRVGAVDRYLETIGRAAILSSSEGLDRINRVEKSPGLSPLRANPRLVDELAAIVMGTRSPG